MREKVYKLLVKKGIICFLMEHDGIVYGRFQALLRCKRCGKKAAR